MNTTLIWLIKLFLISLFLIKYKIFDKLILNEKDVWFIEHWENSFYRFRFSCLLKRFCILIKLTIEFRRVISYQMLILLSNWFKNCRIIVWVVDSKVSRWNSKSKLFQIMIIWLKTNFISTILTYLKMF